MIEAIKQIFCLNKKNLMANLILRNLRIKYRQSLLGFLWTMLIPGLTALVYYVVFSYILKVKIERHLFFILCGILPWQFVSSALTGGLESLQYNSQIINKVPIPPQIFPLSECLTVYLNFLFSIPILILVGILQKSPISWVWLLIPFVWVALFISTYCITLVLAVAFLFFRDLRHLISVVVQILFYATPILYKFEMVPAQLLPWLSLNPWSVFFIVTQKILILCELPNLTDLAVIAIWTILPIWVAYWVLRKFGPMIAENT